MRWPLITVGELARGGAEFEGALRRAGRLGEQLVRGMHDGLTDGTIAPDGDGAPARAPD